MSWSWFTGRNEIYEDEDAVNLAIEDLQNISTNDFETAKSEVQNAVNNLNACRGFEQYVGYTNPFAFDELLDYGKTAIDEIIAQIQKKADDIKVYNESSGFEKLIGTILMSGAKFGEGILDVGESIVDTGAMLIGAGAASLFGKNAEDVFANFVKIDMSHALFNNYYKTDLAKASVFTEDSGISSVVEGFGTTTGYLALGGLTASVGSKIMSSASNLKLIKAAKAVGTFISKGASSTTLANTAVAATAGFGAGSEAGLQQGKSYGEALKQGAITGGVQGTAAFGLGKLGELANKTSTVNKAKAEWERRTKLKPGEPGNLNGAAALSEANRIQALEDAPLSSFQGYTDAITQKGMQDGLIAASKNIFTHPINTLKSFVTSPASGITVASNVISHPVAEDFKAENQLVAKANNLKNNISNVNIDLDGSSQNASTNSGVNTNVNTNNSGDVSGGGYSTGYYPTTGGGSSSSGVVNNASETFEHDANTDKDNASQSTTSDKDVIKPEKTETENENNSSNTFKPSTDENEGVQNTTPVNPTPDDSSNSNLNDSQQSTNNGNDPVPGNPVNTGGTASNGSDNYHSGGGYNSYDGYESTTPPDDSSDQSLMDSVKDTIEDSKASIDDVIKNSYTKIPTSSKPISSQSSSSGSSVIPVIAGLSAAAAAGIGTKAYLDRKENSDNGEESDEIATDEWTGEDNLELEYDDNQENQESYFDDDDDYSYQAEPVEKYDARSNEELADLQ